MAVPLQRHIHVSVRKKKRVTRWSSGANFRKELGAGSIAPRELA
jgi:hypothetical protein